MLRGALIAAGALGLVFTFGSSATPTLHVSTTGHDTGSCVASPCATFDYAYRQANPGQTVEVAAGHYGAQTIRDDPDKDGAGLAAITIRSAPQATVTIGDLVSLASNVRYEGFVVRAGEGGQPDIRGGHHVTVENVKATNFYIQGPTRHVTIKGGEYGPYLSEGGGSQIKTLTAGGDDPDPAAQPHDTVIDGVSFHDYTVPAGSSAHLDCLHVFYHVAITIRNSRFERCKHYGVLLGGNGDPAEHDLVENNFFGEAGVAGFALRGGPEEDFDDVTVRYNSGGSITPQTVQRALRNVTWYANAADDIGDCRDEIAYAYNMVRSGARCAGTDVRADPGFRDRARGDFHLVIGSAAVDRGGPQAPARDIDGDRRPQGAHADAGADELAAAGAPVTSPPITGKVSVRSRRPHLAGRVVRIRLRCTGGTAGLPCADRLLVRARVPRGSTTAQTIGRARFTLPSRTERSVKVRITLAGRRAVRAARLRATVTVRLRGVTRARRTVTIAAP